MIKLFGIVTFWVFYMFVKINFKIWQPNEKSGKVTPEFCDKMLSFLGLNGCQTFIMKGYPDDCRNLGPSRGIFFIHCCNAMFRYTFPFHLPLSKNLISLSRFPSFSSRLSFCSLSTMLNNTLPYSGLK